MKLISALAAAALVAGCAIVPAGEDLQYVPASHINVECTLIGAIKSSSVDLDIDGCAIKGFNGVCHIRIAIEAEACVLPHERRHCAEGAWHGTVPTHCDKRV